MTVLLPGTRQEVDRLRETLKRDKLAPWAWFNSRGVNITDFYGGRISISGCTYSTSQALVFFEFIAPFLKEAIVNTLDNTIEVCRARQYAPEPYIRETAMLLEGHLIAPTYEYMAEIDRRIRGKGNPRSVGREDVTGSIADMARFLNQCKEEMVEAARFEAFVMSAKGETSTRSFQEWAGGERVTLAIVFTDVVGSTALGEEIKDEAMSKVRRAHFDQSRKLISQFKGREIKTMGDGFMAAFKCVDAALDYALALHGNTGHPQVQIRAGIHIGPMQVEEGDVFGDTVNFAARVIGAITGAEIWLSHPAKEHIGGLGAARHKRLQWKPHEGVAVKGFAGPFTLWSVKTMHG